MKDFFYLFHLKTLAYSSGRFGLDETLTECKASIIFKHNNFIPSNAVISFKYKLKNVPVTFQLIFLLNFLTLRAFEILFYTWLATSLRCRLEIV